METRTICLLGLVLEQVVGLLVCSPLLPVTLFVKQIVYQVLFFSPFSTSIVFVSCGDNFVEITKNTKYIFCRRRYTSPVQSIPWYIWYMYIWYIYIYLAKVGNISVRPKS